VTPGAPDPVSNADLWPQVIRENSLGTKKKGLRSNAVSDGYMVPPQRCATCGQGTKGSFHAECRRDSSGRLFVVEEVQR
jgi:hypothetical protein